MMSLLRPSQRLAVRYLSTNARVTGTVRWYDLVKGYGFIDASNGQDIFVHQSQITATGFRGLLQGETVEFEVIPRANHTRRLCAGGVSAPGGAVLDSARLPKKPNSGLIVNTVFDRAANTLNITLAVPLPRNNSQRAKSSSPVKPTQPTQPAQPVTPAQV